MSIQHWALFVGILLLTMMVVNTLLRRLPLTAPMVYLAVGAVLGPAGMSVLRPDPMVHTPVLEHLAETALLVSLFSVGLSLEPRLRDRQWHLPVKLAFVSLALTVALVAAAGVWLLDLPVGAAIVLGAILAPTDPVLASALQPAEGGRPHRLSFTLAAEGALNDGSAFPFMLLGLGLLGLGHHATAEWLLMDVAWATVGGLAIGAALGAAIGRTVLLLRRTHDLAIGLDVFLGLGVMATAYGVASISHASTFLAVFAAGVALRRVREHGPAGELSSRAVRGAVEGFNAEMEKIAEMGLVLLLGAMLPYAPYTHAVWWFVPFLLLVVRPVSVLPSYVGERAGPAHVAMSAWFGIRGIGSLFYLLLALRVGLGGSAAPTIVSLTLWTVATSIVLHGLTARPLMQRYLAAPVARSP